MKSGLSLYLDIFRLAAALIVVISHAHLPQLGGSWFTFSFGQEAVEGFFVLSGFIIAYVVATREREIAAYGAARLARLWSILLPALALTPLIDAIGHQLSPTVYDDWGAYMGFDNPILRLASAAVFLNQTWFFSVAPLSNMPIWSLGFEAWYYALFAAFVFSPRASRNWIVGAVAVVAGPKILLLMPAWLFGAWVYNKRQSIRLGRAHALGFFLAGPALIVGFKALHVVPLLHALETRLLGVYFVEIYLTFAQDFLWQNLVGFLICIHFAGAVALAESLGRLLKPAERAIRIAAGYTLSIYLLHFPLELLIAAGLHDRPDGPLKTASVIVGALALSVAIGAILQPIHPRLRAGLLGVFRSRAVGAAKGLLPAQTQT